MSDAEKLAQVGNTVYFGFDSADLTGGAQSTLDRQAAFLNVNPTLVVIVEGHADERGTREYNLALGDRRATAVRDYLLAKGLNSARIRTVSYGKRAPRSLRFKRRSLGEKSSCGDSFELITEFQKRGAVAPLFFA